MISGNPAAVQADLSLCMTHMPLCWLCCCSSSIFFSFRKRSVAQYSLPVSAVKKTFTHFAGMRVSKEAVDEVMKV